MQQTITTMLDGFFGDDEGVTGVVKLVKVVMSIKSFLIYVGASFWAV